MGEKGHINKMVDQIIIIGFGFFVLVVPKNDPVNFNNFLIFYPSILRDYR